MKKHMKKLVVQEIDFDEADKLKQKQHSTMRHKNSS